ncbi:hypothetical protein B566_EDAN005092 [Ephemera danica]|nr:hypothetical protein B566_EDAN005092 [Ephemera danica]
MILNTEYARRAGSMMRIWVFFKPYMLVYSGSDAAALLTHPSLTVKSDTHSILKDVVGDNIFTTHGRRWSLYRKHMLPAFRINALRELMPTFVRHALSLTKRLADEAKSSNDTEIFSLVDLCAFGIICESTMCMEMQLQVDAVHGRSRFNKAVTRSFELLIERYLSPLTLPDALYRFTSARQEYDSEVKYIKDFCRQVIANRRKSTERINEELYRTNENQEKKTSLSLLDILLTAEESGIEFMTEEDTLNNIFALIIAGYETSSTAICWSLFLLGTYPEIQAKVVEELVEVFGNSGRVPDVADLANLKYLERCIKESLRIYPSTPFFERSVDEEIKLDKYTLPAGCHVVFNTYLLHRDPEVFPEPEKFDPDRFLPENCTSRHPFAFLPFGGGPRICI